MSPSLIFPTRHNLHKRGVMKYVFHSSIQCRGAYSELNVIVYTHMIGKLINRKCGMLLLFLLWLNPHRRRRKFRYHFSSSMYGRTLIRVWKERKGRDVTPHPSTSPLMSDVNKVPPDKQVIGLTYWEEGWGTDGSWMGVSKAESWTSVATTSPATSNDRVRRPIHIQHHLYLPSPAAVLCFVWFIFTNFRKPQLD